MPEGTIRVLLLADTHLGLGEEFFANFERALQPALRGDVDLVVHGGDVFYRSRVKPSLVLRAFDPLKRIADAGVPVFVVPGNHERSAIPFPLLASHPRVHIFDRPRTFTLTTRGVQIAVAGFPCVRNGVREEFLRLLSDTAAGPADVRLLVLHQSVEGATVGPADFVFRGGPDVIPGRMIPRGFAAVLAGHIHRHQVLTRNLAAPVVYPGSTARTSHAEDGETKGFVTLQLEPGDDGGRLRSLEFHPHI